MQGNAYLRNGHLVYQERPNASFSWLRFSVISSILFYLFATNPANHDHTAARIFRTISRQQQQQPSNSYYYAAKQQQQRTTNFGIFSIQDSVLKLKIQVAGRERDCRYDDPDIGLSFCQRVLRQHLTHQKPLLPQFWNDDDPVFGIYRCLAWGIVSAAVLSLCFTQPLTVPSSTGNNKIPLVNSFWSLFLNPSPVWSALYNLVMLNVFIYPALESMYTAVQQQSSDSFFSWFGGGEASADSTNFYVSCAVLLLIALVANEASCRWSGTFVLRFEAVTAVAMGYYANYMESLRYETIVFPLLDQSFSFQTAAWTVLLTAVFRSGSVAAAFFWCLAYCAGYSLSQYHYEHLAYIVSARSLYDWMGTAAGSVERGLRNLFGYGY